MNHYGAMGESSFLKITLYHSFMSGISGLFLFYSLQNPKQPLSKLGPCFSMSDGACMK